VRVAGGRFRHRPYRAWQPTSRARFATPLMPVAFTACGPRLAVSRPTTRALPERTIGPQISAVSGPLARTIGDLRIALAAMSAYDVRDPWWVPAAARRADDAEAGGVVSEARWLETVAEVKAAVADAGKRLERAGWTVEGGRDHAAAARGRRASDQAWAWRWLRGHACRRTSGKAIPVHWPALRGNRAKVFPFDAAAFSRALTRRAIR